MKYFSSIGVKKDFKLLDFLFWFTLAVVFPAVSGNLTFINILKTFVYMGVVHFAGEQLLKKITIINEIPSLLSVGLYIILGSIVCGILFMVIPYSAFLYLFFIAFLYDIYRNKKIILKFSFYHFLCLAPFIIVLFQTYELEYAIRERVSRAEGDYFYYTALVESLKTNQSVSSSVFHLGLPINYPSLPFMAPALLANFTGIPSQFSLWGIYMKILPVACLSTVAYTIVKLYETLFDIVKAESKRFPWKLLIAGLLLLFLGPLHFINLLKFDFKNTLFLGSGYLLPTGSPGFALAMILSAMVLSMVIAAKKFSFYYSALIVLLLCFVLISKIALFFPLAILVGLISLWRLSKNEKDLFFTLLIAFPVCILAYVFIIGSSDSVMSVHFTTQGFFQKYFSDLADKYHVPGHGLLRLLIMTAIIIFMWISIKVAILALAFKAIYKNNSDAAAIIVAAVLSFFICLLPGFFIESVGKDNAGKILFDGSFDMGQFARGSIFLFTTITLVFALYLLFNHSKAWIRKSCAFIFLICSFIIAFSFFSTFYAKANVPQQGWYFEVRNDYLKTKPHLMAMMGNEKYSGQAVTAIGVHPWYCTGTREENEGYIFTKTGYDRNYAFRNIFDSSNTINKRKIMADSLKKIGIDCIVASPSSIQKIMKAVEDSIVSPISDTKWMYHLN